MAKKLVKEEVEELAKMAKTTDQVSGEVMLKRLNWAVTQNEYQKMPEGDWWDVWLFLAGRGAGKTRTAAETIWQLAWDNPKTRTLVSAPTFQKQIMQY